MIVKEKFLINNGQALLEVLMALGIVILVVMAILRGVVLSVKSNDLSKSKSQAISFTKEGMEIIRLYRDNNNWSSFYSKAYPPAGEHDYCLSSTTPSGTCNSSCSKIGDIFTRCAYFRRENNNKVRVRVGTSWTDSTGLHKSEVDTFFTNW